MAKDDLLKKLIDYRNSLTWEFDRKAVDQWITSVQKSIAKSDLLDTDPIKEFIALKEIRIKECDLELMNNRDLTDAERKLIFTKRDILQQDINFFKDAQIIVDAAEKLTGKK